MDNVEGKIREQAAQLLREEQVDVVVGFEAGSLPLTAAPVFITRAEEAERLVWNAACRQNLALYVQQLLAEHAASQQRKKPEERTKKVVAVVAPGCATRSIAIHLNERQYARDDVVVLGVPCSGMVDRHKVLAAAGSEELLDGAFENGQIRVRSAGGETLLERSAVLADSCASCAFNNPVMSDVDLGQAAAAPGTAEEFAGVAAFAERPDQERWEYFQGEMEKCLRCYACRNACPSCYCRTCFVDQSQPDWVGIGQDSADTQLFHIMRLYHMAGRCVDCGSCAAVCPMGVDLRTFFKKLDQDALELFGGRAGVSVEDAAVLAEAKEDDPEGFIYDP